MMFVILSLLGLGLIVGLSGAIIPGPLLSFTIFDTSTKGKVTGHYVIVGHVIWEAGIILLIILGFGWIFTQNSYVIYLLGGGVLFFMGVIMMRSRKGEVKMENPRVNSSLGGGVFYTAFNPTQPVWWATAGLALLLKGLEIMGVLGVLLVTLGHWASDFGYYAFVSYMINRHKKFVNPHQHLITMILALFMVFLGVIFCKQGLETVLQRFGR